jgi:hypothetical protein
MVSKEKNGIIRSEERKRWRRKTLTNRRGTPASNRGFRMAKQGSQGRKMLVLIP